MKNCILTVLLLLMSIPVLCQDIKVIHFNAGWNGANDVKWFEKLSDCEKEKVDIAVKLDLQKKFNVVVVPTIIILQDGDEVERYQADLSFKIAATREEVQDYIDELIMSAF